MDAVGDINKTFAILQEESSWKINRCINWCYCWELELLTHRAGAQSVLELPDRTSLSPCSSAWPLKQRCASRFSLSVPWPLYFSVSEIFFTLEVLSSGDDFTVQLTTAHHPVFISSWLWDVCIQMSCQKLRPPACSRPRRFLFQTQFISIFFFSLNTSHTICFTNPPFITPDVHKSQPPWCLSATNVFISSSTDKTGPQVPNIQLIVKAS